MIRVTSLVMGHRIRLPTWLRLTKKTTDMTGWGRLSTLGKICAIPLLPLAYCYFFYAEAEERISETEWKRRRDHRQLWPKPDSSSSFSQSIARQKSARKMRETKPRFGRQRAQTGFFRLPLEIRLVIYDLAFGLNNIHLFVENSAGPKMGLRTFSCHCCEGYILSHVHATRQLGCLPHQTLNRVWPDNLETLGLGVLNLILTCQSL